MRLPSTDQMRETLERAHREAQLRRFEFTDSEWPSVEKRETRDERGTPIRKEQRQ